MKRIPTMLLLAVSLCACSRAPEPAVETPTPDQPAASTSQITGAPFQGGQAQLPYLRDPQQVQEQRLPELRVAPPGWRKSMQNQAVTLSGATQPGVVAMRVLVIGSSATESGLSAATAFLQEHAIPYDVLNAATTSLTDESLIAPDGTGRYQGIVLTTGSLAFEEQPGVWNTAFTPEEWERLWAYERLYHVRQLSLYTYPSSWPEDYGLRDLGRASGEENVQATPAGQAVFSDLKPGITLPVRYAWNYPAGLAAVPDITTTPLLTDSAGAVLAARSDTADGRERLALTVAHNPYLLHSQLLSSGLLEWLTRGVHLGSYRRYLQVDVDDWFLEDDLWNAQTASVQGTYRLSASDALGVRDQQQALEQQSAVSSAFRFAIAFNAGGANLNAPKTCTPGTTSPDPLTSVTRCLNTTFDWVNHSRDHISMDFASYSVAYQQFQGNQTRADKLGLRYSPQAAISGEHSGLGWYNAQGLDYNKTDYGLSASNLSFLNAASDAGVRYLASNHAVASHWDAACPNCGVVHPLKANLFLVPRWPTNLFYYASTPDEVVSSYNAMYGPGGLTPTFDHALNYQEILAKETEIALSHVLNGAMFPHYLHQTNLRQYASGRSLAYDWTSSVINAYSQYSTMPLRTLAWKDLGAYLKERTGFIKTPVTGLWNRQAGTVTLNSPSAVTAFLTGISAGSAESYAGQVLSRVPLQAGTSVTLTLPAQP